MGRKIILKNFLLTTAATLLVGCSGGFVNEPQDEPVNVHSIYNGDFQMWNHIFEMGEDAYEFDAAPFGVIIPHHMIVGYNLAKFYNGMSKVVDPSVVVLVGPNHYENGEANIQTCVNCVYKTTHGDVEVDLDYIGKMIDDGVALKQDDTFLNEHSMHAHAPYIQHYFPNAQVVPIVLQWEMPVDEVLDLSSWLDENLPADALVIASVDFSHYISLEAANFHDRSSLATIMNFDFANIYDLELDSPSSIYLLLDLMKRRGFEHASRLDHTNLYNTSHQYFAFYEGAAQPVQGISVMLLNGVAADFDILDAWDWDRIKRSEEEDPLYNLRGDEDRFLVGSDYLIFDFECHSLEQNGMVEEFCPADLPVDLQDVIAGIYITPHAYEITFLSGTRENELVKFAR